MTETTKRAAKSNASSLIDELEAMLAAVEDLAPKIKRATEILVRAGQIIED